MNLPAAYSTNFHPLKPWFSATESQVETVIREEFSEGVAKPRWWLEHLGGVPLYTDRHPYRWGATMFQCDC